MLALLDHDRHGRPAVFPFRMIGLGRRSGEVRRGRKEDAASQDAQLLRLVVDPGQEPGQPCVAFTGVDLAVTEVTVQVILWHF